MKSKRIIMAITGYVLLFFVLTYVGFVFELALQGI